MPGNGSATDDRIEAASGFVKPMGHTSSYDEFQAVDTCLAALVMAKLATYGTDISAGSFVELATDNNDLSEQALDGKNPTTTLVTRVTAYDSRISFTKTS